MKTLTEEQIARLAKAVSRLDDLTEKRPPIIADEAALADVIAVVNTACTFLKDGQPITVLVEDRYGALLAKARIEIESA